MVSLVEFIECELEARHEGVEEVADLGKIGTFDRCAERFFRMGKFFVANADFFQTFKVGTQFIGGLDQHEVAGVRFFIVEEWLIVRLQFGRDHTQKSFIRSFFNSMVGGFNVGVEVFDWRREVAGKDLTGVVIQGQCRHSVRIDISSKQPVTNDR